jgi:DNA-binding MarR family transcriptional regulator
MSGYFRIGNDFIDLKRLSDFSGDEIKTYLVFLRRSNTGKDECFPSYDDITDKTGIDSSKVATIIKSLQEKNYLEITQRGERGIASEYKVFTTPDIKQITTVQSSIPALTIQKSDPYQDLKSYCIGRPFLSGLALRIEKDWLINEIEFPIKRKITNFQKDEFLTTFLEAIKTKNLMLFNSRLVSFNIQEMVSSSC